MVKEGKEVKVVTEENKDETLEEVTPDEAAENSEAVDETEAVAEVSEVDQLKTELDEMEDKYLRARAEMANIANRSKNERELLVRYRSQDLAKKLLTSIDNLERALETTATDDHGASLKKGVEMVLEGVLNALKEEGVEEIVAKDATFDPKLHQAIQTVPAEDGVAPETIVQVFQKGYKLQDRVLRPAMVVVAQ
jgi:molecular chaperone GrpE